MSLDQLDELRKRAKVAKSKNLDQLSMQKDRQGLTSAKRDRAEHDLDALNSGFNQNLHYSMEESKAWDSRQNHKRAIADNVDAQAYYKTIDKAKGFLDSTMDKEERKDLIVDQILKREAQRQRDRYGTGGDSSSYTQRKFNIRLNKS